MSAAFAAASAIFSGVSEAQRIGGLDRPERAEAETVGGAPADALRLEIDQGAIEGVPRRPGRHLPAEIVRRTGPSAIGPAIARMASTTSSTDSP